MIVTDKDAKQHLMKLRHIQTKGDLKMIKLIPRHEKRVTKIAPEFAKVWSEQDFNLVKNKVNRFFYNYNVYNPDNYFGLPYTSSGAFAAIWNTNVLFPLEFSGKAYNFEYIALDKETKEVYFAFWDIEENEIFVRG